MFRFAAAALSALLVGSLLGADGTWSTKANLPESLAETTAVLVDGRMYVVGGMKGGDTDAHDDLLIYNVAGNSWSRGTNLPIPLHHPIAVAYNGEVWVISGWTGGSTLTDRMFVYTPSTNAWREIPHKIPFPVAGAASWVYDNAIYVVGGSRNNNFNTSQFGKIQRYTPATGTWSTDFTEMPWGRNHINAIVVGHEVYVSPGRPDISSSGSLNNRSGNKFHKYNHQTNAWTTLANTLTQIDLDRSASAFMAVDGKFYLLGGEPGVRTNCVYDPASNQWTRLADIPSSIPGFHGTQGVVVGRAMYIPAGGSSVGAGQPTNVLRVLTIPGGTTDTQAPTQPGSFAATATGQTTASLSWSASTDNMGVTGYEVKRGSTVLGTVTGTSYADSGLTAGTTYSWSVRAKDAAGNFSTAATASATTDAATPDTTAPTQPGNLTATATGATAVSLSWSASTDAVGVTGYEVSRGGSVLGTVTGTSYADSGLTPETTYSYAVRARDAAGNWSTAATAGATTPAAPAAGDPLVWWRFEEGSGTTVADAGQYGWTGTLSSGATWTTGPSGGAVVLPNPNLNETRHVSAGTRPVGGGTALTVALWMRNDGTASYTGGLASHLSRSGGTYNGGWELNLTSGKLSFSKGDPVAKTFNSTVTTAALSALADGQWHHVAVTWGAATGTTRIFLDGVEVKSGSQPSTSLGAVDATLRAGLTAINSNEFNGALDDVRIYGSELDAATIVALATGGGSGGDTTAPTQPGSLAATATSATAVSLTWTASTDYVGVTGYEVSRGGTVLGTVTTTSYADSGLTASTAYSYSVVALDAAGNRSTAATAGATTPAAPDTTAPTQPGSLAATATSATAVSLTWTASTDDVGVTGYEVSRGGTVLGTVTTTSYADSGLTASTTYSYSVVAVDAAGNRSTAATVGATTPAAPAAGDPLVWWRFSEGSGTTVADSGTNGWTGTLQNAPTWITGQIGNAVDLDNPALNEGRFVSAGSRAVGDGTAVTVALWLRNDRTANYDAGLVSHQSRSGGTYNGGYELSLTSGKLSFSKGDPEAKTFNSPVTTAVLPALTDGQWHHVAATWSAATGTTRIHLDGVEVKSGSQPSASLGTANADFRSGMSGINGREFDGAIDEVRVYGQALDAAAIEALAAPAGNG